MKLWENERDGIRCFACGHRCFIPEGRSGICKVRSNDGGTLHVPRGYVAGLQLDPIEKKPFFHVHPGVETLSFGMLGCDFRCAYCQNWFTSQVERDPTAQGKGTPMSALEIVSLAMRSNAKILTSTYNEPLITSEWAIEILTEAKKQGIRGAYVSNGNATREVLEYIRPYVDYYKIDLKSFRDKSYRELGGVLSNVLDSIQLVYQMGFWLEIVTLIIPGLNDSDQEIDELTKFVAGVSPEIPWHATAFHPDYKMMEVGRTQAEKLIRIGEIGKRNGLKFVYLGNCPGQLGDWENTRCPGCNELLIERRGFQILKNTMKSSECPKCLRKIPGHFASADRFGAVTIFPEREREPEYS